MNLFDLHGRSALITGASKGIGYALAQALGAAGARVVLNARGAEALGQAVQTLRSQGIQADAAAFDVTDADAVDAGVAAIERDIGAIDILVNNAGMQHRGNFAEFPTDAWHKITTTNIDSVFFVGRAVAQRMIARKAGKIINICSVQSELGRPGIAPYAATKGAVKMLTKAMATEWGPKGLNVNGIGPGYFKTELTDALVNDKTFTAWLEARTPQGRWGDVEELVGAAIYLASNASVYVNGHVLYVDGGLTSSV